jgi:hypothetical protein
MRALILGEFTHPERLLAAVRRLRQDGFLALDTYTPYPVNGTSEALGLRRSRIPLVALLGGLTGATTAYVCQYLMVAWDYPINVGGRPEHAAPAFIPITFELAVLFSALAIFFGLMFFMKLPQPYHPAFEVEAFASASNDAFWVSVETEQADRAGALLREAGAARVEVVREEGP